MSKLSFDSVKGIAAHLSFFARTGICFIVPEGKCIVNSAMCKFNYK